MSGVPAPAIADDRPVRWRCEAVDGAARAGWLATPHGTVPTPCFMAVATCGGLKGVVEVRGQGLMIGMELDRPCGVLVTRAAEAGLLISVTADKVVRLLPPLIFTKSDADECVGILAPLVKAFLAE